MENILHKVIPLWKEVKPFAREEDALLRAHQKEGAKDGRRYLVIRLGGDPSEEKYPLRWTDEPPYVFDDSCRTMDLWLRRIPAGTFTMGDDSCGPPHKVTISQDYFMGIFPVTQCQWELVMGNNPSDFKSVGSGAPVENVSYNDICGVNRRWPASADVAADSFLGKLRAGTGLEGFDLPTEAQWEYACRAGTSTALNNGKNLTYEMDAYPNLDEVGWYDKNSRRTIHRVGEKRPNAWGLYDMHGNIWEWCRDGYTGFYGGDAIDPAGPADSPFRANRGGCWYYDGRHCSSAYRNYGVPGDRNCFSGLRLVLSPIR